MTPLRDDLLDALRANGRMPAADAAVYVGTTAQIARVALHAMIDSGTVRFAKHERSIVTGRLAATFEAVR